MPIANGNFTVPKPTVTGYVTVSATAAVVADVLKRNQQLIDDGSPRYSDIMQSISDLNLNEIIADVRVWLDSVGLPIDLINALLSFF